MIAKVLNVQRALKAPKSQFNKFGGYNYRNCEDILEAVKPLLAENGLILTISDEVVLIGDRYYIKATAILTDGQQRITTTAYAREEENKKGMDASQLTGSTSSYARKYALNGLFCIDDNKDADTTNDHGKGENQPDNKKPAKQPKPKQQQEQTPPGIPCSVCGKMLTVEYANKAREHYGTVICSVACGHKAGIEI